MDLINKIFENRHKSVYVLNNNKEIIESKIVSINNDDTVDILSMKMPGFTLTYSILDYGKLWSFDKKDLELGAILYKSSLISAFNRLTEGRVHNKNYETVWPEIERIDLVNRALRGGIYTKSSRTGLISFCPRVKYAWRKKCNELVLYTSAHAYVNISDFGVTWAFTRGELMN